jgi:hypothetical protein
MREPVEKFRPVTLIHRHQWLWEPLASDPTFVLRSMFGTKAVYLRGKLVLAFCAREEPWRGVLVCTEHAHQASLRADFAELTPHPILPKWLYLPESCATFERAGERLVALARQQDPRLGITPRLRAGAARPMNASRGRRTERP